jgi:hypothetical protein
MRSLYALMLFLIAPFASGNSFSLVAQDDPGRRLDIMARNMLLIAEDPLTGSWKLNVAKSKFDPGPPLKSGTVRTEVHGSSFKCVMDPVDAQGTARHGEWTAKMDGKDSPAAMAPYADAIALERIDSETLDAAYKRQGKAILSERWIFSKDRKTLTVVQKEINATGQGFNNSLVYDRE